MDRVFPEAINLFEEIGCRREATARSLSFFATVLHPAVDERLVDQLEILAESNKSNARLCLHPDKDSALQEMVIVQRSDRYFPPKRHPGKAKHFSILRGELAVFWFHEDGRVDGATVLSKAGARMCRIESGVYHADIPLTPTAAHQEVTIGPFRGDADREIPPWAPAPHAMTEFRAKLIQQAGLENRAADRAMLRRLSHVCLGSRNILRTVEFYSKLLGCSVAHEFRNPAGELYGVFLSCRNGTFLEFFNEQAPKPPGGLFRHICFEVEDIQAMAEEARSLGHRPEVKRGRTDHILGFFVYDPDGNTIEFHQHDRQSVLFGLIPENH